MSTCFCYSNVLIAKIFSDCIPNRNPCVVFGTCVSPSEGKIFFKIPELVLYRIPCLPVVKIFHIPPLLLP